MIDIRIWEVADYDFQSERQLAVEPWHSAGLETGDARYFIVADTFKAIAAEFEDRGCIPEPRFEQIWSALRSGLPRIRDAADPEVAAPLADTLFREVTSVLSGPWPQEIR